MADIGSIIVTERGIIARAQKADGSVQCGYDAVTVENLLDAARLLAAWMDLKYADVAAECRRVHRRDQTEAMLYETIEQYMNHKEQT